jgi:hypothetical protein
MDKKGCRKVAFFYALLIFAKIGDCPFVLTNLNSIRQKIQSGETLIR